MSNQNYFLQNNRQKAPSWLRNSEPLIEARVTFKNNSHRPLLTFANTLTQLFKQLAPRIDDQCIITTCFYMKDDQFKTPWLIYRFDDECNLKSKLLTDDSVGWVDEPYFQNVIIENTSPHMN